jgi:hypothetical protein
MSFSGWHILAIKLAALLSFCGGPLYVADLLKPALGRDVAFGVAFAPLAMATLCAFSLWEDHPWSWGKYAIAVGLLGAVIVAATSVFAISQLSGGPDRADRSLIVLGSIVGLAVAAAYAWLAWRRLGPSVRR